MHKIYLYTYVLILTLFISFLTYSQKSQLNREVEFYNNAKKIFLNKNYQIAFNAFEEFKENFSNSLLFNDAQYYSYLCQVYSNQIVSNDDLENFINNNNVLKYQLLSASYGEHLFDLELFDKAIKYLMLSKLSNYDILFKIGYSYYILGDYIFFFRK